MSGVAIGVTVGVAVLGLLYTFTNSGRPRNDVQKNNYGSYNYGANNPDDRNSNGRPPSEMYLGGRKSKTLKKSKTQRKSRKRS